MAGTNARNQIEPINWRAAQCLCLGVLLLGATEPAPAQTLEAFDDRFAIPFGLTLDVEPFGVLENDELDGENAGESGATAVLVTDVSYGTLNLSSDGSFTYQVGAGFDGTDQFVYRAEFGAASAEATVILSACDGGPDVFTCWNETAFRAQAQALGFPSFDEGFESEVTWGMARTPFSAPSILSQGIEWQSNHPNAPASNPISTTSGPPHSGQWAVYDPNHGYATGTPGQCDIDNPPEHCLFHDGFTGTRQAGMGVLHGVGGYLNGIYGANVGILLDGAPPIGGGKLTFGHQFFGVIDARPAGFTQFEFRELDGKIGQALFVWGDDFTIVTDGTVGVPEVAVDITPLRIAPNPAIDGTDIRFSVPRAGQVRLSIYDVRGRLVRRLLDDHRAAGPHSISWDQRDADGVEVAAGVYFVRLVIHGSETGGVTGRGIVVVK